MSNKTRQCPFTGCGRFIDPDFFACGRHWKTLDNVEQAEIYAAFYEWRAGVIDGDELRRRQQAVLGLRGTA